MAIIYSYPKSTQVYGSDCLIISRIEPETNNNGSTLNIDVDTLKAYVNADGANTLDQVLNAGNISIIPAKIGDLYLYNENVGSGNGYVYITGNKNRFNFYNNADVYYANISQDSLVLVDAVVPSREFQINKPVITANRIATFQDASGTIAYLDDISSLTLDQVLYNGNISTNDASIGDLYLFDTSNDSYGFISSNNERINFYNSNNLLCGSFNRGSISIDDPSSPSIMNLTVSPLSDSRDVALPDKTGTIALLSDIPTIPVSNNYGLAAQIDSSTNIVNTIVESTLISNEYEGTLSVPPNGFAVGDSFKVSLMGHINCLSSATLRIRIKTSAGVIFADTGAISLETATAKHWKLDIEFTIRQIGGEGIASIVSGGSFSYNKDASNNPESITFISINNTNFKTTISNELAITAQWNNANSSNAIYSDIFTLNKVY